MGGSEQGTARARSANGLLRPAPRARLGWLRHIARPPDPPRSANGASQSMGWIRPVTGSFGRAFLRPHPQAASFRKPSCTPSRERRASGSFPAPPSVGGELREAFLRPHPWAASFRKLSCAPSRERRASRRLCEDTRPPALGSARSCSPGLDQRLARAGSQQRLEQRAWQGIASYG